jgi:LuxR family maltose regulon positive regulatory protein
MLMDDSEGWIAGIILALHASRDQSMKPQRYGSGGARYLDEYLSEEVISQLPETLQQFMLKTSVLPVLDPALCDFALETTGSAEAIQSLVLRYGFVVEQAGVVRFHHLFALVLQKMAEASLADDLFTIRHRAIIWFLDRDDADQAAELSVALGDWDLATPILRTCLRPHAERSLFALMCHWFNRIPDRVIAADAELGFWASVAWLIWGDSSRAESLLETCLPYWQSSGEPLHVGRMHVCRALLLQTRRQFAEAHTRAHQAIDILPEESKLERMYAYSLLAFTATRLGDDGDAQQATVLARACAQHLPAGEQWSPLILVPYAANAAIVRGNIHSAEAMCQMAIGQMPDYQWRAAGAIWAVLVETAIERNDLDTALDVIARYNNIPASSGDVFHFESEMTAIALLVAQSAYPEAEQRLMALRTQSGTSLPLANRERIDAQLARIWFETDRLHLVREWLRQVDLSDSHWPHVRGMGARLTQVDLALVDGEFSRAIHLLRQLIAEGTALKHWGNLVAYHARLAVAYQQLGRAKDAFESLSVALEIGIPGGFVRSFLVPRYDIIPLVRNHVAVHDSPKQCKFLLERLAHKEPPVTNGVLTAREREVMMLVAQGHSNQEIADTLFVSVNTVKNHVASINRKLVVRSRVASVARARELGIIS